jgi:hypothetical protein
MRVVHPYWDGLAKKASVDLDSDVLSDASPQNRLWQQQRLDATRRLACP